MYIRVPVMRCASGPLLVAISRERLRNLAEANMMGKLFEAELLLLEDGVLSNPIGMFHGLRRPMKVPGRPEWLAENVVACVANPARAARYTEDGRVVTGPLPASVFVTYAMKINDPGQRNQIRQHLNADHCQVYLADHWEWLPSDPGDATLPNEFTTRYDGRLPCP